MDRLDFTAAPTPHDRRSRAVAARHLRRPGRLAAWALGAALAIAAFALPGGPAARASVVRALSLTQLTYKADEILLAVPTEQRSRRHAAGRMIVTDFDLRVEDVLKGRTKPGANAVATVLGGKLQDLALQVPGEASFAIGQRVLVFLYRSPATSDLRVVGMSQGVLPVRADGRTMMVMPAAGGAALVESGADADEEPALSAPAALDDVVRRVRALVAQQGQTR